jgi:8-oxo-dGTP diphosphatase
MGSMLSSSHMIDKLAFLLLKEKKLLMTLSHGKDTYYIPGGKREEGETDQEALIREVKEELTVDLIPSTIVHYGTFEAQAHGKPLGTIVRMICYVGEFTGVLTPGNEIDKIEYYSFSQRNIVGPVDQIIFDDLNKKGLLT